MGYIAKGKGSAAPIEFNFKGQPIGPNAPKLATLLGATIRELVPITAESFNTKDKQLTNQIWEHVKMWRDHRSALVRDVKEQAKRIGLNRAIANLKPNNVDLMDEWKAFMKKKMCSAECEAKSEIFKKMRASQTLPHTTSRKGYARLEEELGKKSDNPDDLKRVDVWFKGHEPKDGIYKDDKAKETMEKVNKVMDESSKDQHSIADDAVSKVIGPERRGRIRGLGFGATQTKLQRSSYHRDKVSKLESQLKEMNDRMNQLDELVRNKLVAPMPEPSGPSSLEGRK